MKKFVSLALVIALLCSPLWAVPAPDPGARPTPQSGGDPANVELVRKRITEALNHPRRVVIETYDNRKLQGLISEVQPDNFVLTVAGRSTTLAYSEVKSVKSSHHMSKHVEALIVAGAVAGALYLVVYLLLAHNG